MEKCLRIFYRFLPKQIRKIIKIILLKIINIYVNFNLSRYELNLINAITKNYENIILVIGGNYKWSYESSRSIKIPEYLSKKKYNVIYFSFDNNIFQKNIKYFNNILFYSFNIFMKLFEKNYFINKLKEILNKINSKYLLIELPIKDIIHFLPFFIENNFIVIYDIRDNWEEFKNRGLISWYNYETEKFILQNSNIVITVSPSLKEKFSEYNPKVIPNGFEKNSFNEKFTINLKRGELTLGYYGHILKEWFDWDLIFYISNLKKSWIIHLIGNIDDKISIKNLPKNIIYHGPVDHSKLMGYTRNWDVAIIPFKINDISRYCDPLKIYEFIYFGLPVVVQGIPHLSTYPNTYIANNYNEFVNKIEFIRHTHLKRNYNEDFIINSLWENRINSFIETLNKNMKMYK